MDWPLALLMAVMLLVVAVLFWGLVTMARGGDYNFRWANTIMRWRVALQALAVLVFVLILLGGIG